MILWGANKADLSTLWRARSWRFISSGHTNRETRDGEKEKRKEDREPKEYQSIKKRNTIGVKEAFMEIGSIFFMFVFILSMFSYS
jgi:hypothetical protein